MKRALSAKIIINKKVIATVMSYDADGTYGVCFKDTKEDEIFYCREDLDEWLIKNNYINYLVEK